MVNAQLYAKSDVGKLRVVNEDAFIARKLWNEHYFLLAAIDGLGGYEGGEVAAQIACEAIIEHFKTEKEIGELESLLDSVQEANNAIVAQKEKFPQYAEMGCVLTVGILDLERMCLNVAHVGDSRLYMYYNDSIQKLTHDHSFVGLLEDNGEISEEIAMHHPKRNLISRIVGAKFWDEDGRQQIESGIYPVKAGMSFLFCSDGLTDMLTSNEIAEQLSQSKSIKSKVETLVEMANKKGGKDNITIVLTSVEEHKSNKEIEKLKKRKKREKRKRKQQEYSSLEVQNNHEMPNTNIYNVIVISIILSVLVAVLLYYKLYIK